MAHAECSGDDSRMTLREERRRQRSDDPLIALHYQLANVRRESKLDAIVVADDSGVVVAGAGAWPVCEELAAYAPLLAQGVWREPGLEPGLDRPRPPEMLGADVDVQPVDLDGQSVLLCARGGWTRTQAMHKAAEGVARILK